MSKSLVAKSFDKDHDYDQYKKDERKKDQSFRQLRRGKRNRWNSTEE